MRLHRVLLAGLAGAQVAYGRVPGKRGPRSTQAVVALAVAATMAEAAAARGAQRGPALVAGAGAIGFATELAGVATGRPFGHYHYGDGLGVKVGGVPLLAAGAWAMMARPAWAVAGRLSERRAARVALAAGALTAWDVFLDPRMVADGYWRWPDGGRYEGVPASNFAGWLLTAAAVFGAWAAAGEGDGEDEDLDAFALYLWTWIGETFANAALWDRPRVAAAGALAMGAFAAPALARSVR